MSDSPTDNNAGDFGGSGASKGDFTSSTGFHGSHLESQLHLFAQTPLASYDVQGAIDDILLGIGESVIVAGASEVAIDAAGGITAVAGAFGGSAVLLIAFVILCVVAQTLVLEAVLWRISGWIPIVGSRTVQPWVTTHFQWLHDLENAAIGKIVDQIQLTLHQWGKLLRLLLVMEGLLPEQSTTKTIIKEVPANAHAINVLQEEINQLRDELRQIQHSVRDHRVPSTVPQNVWDQFHVVEHELYQQQQQIDQIRSDVDKALHQSASVQAQQVELSHTIHQVRALSVGWTDIEERLQDLTTRQTTIQNSTSRRMDTLGREQTHMAPLAILLEPGPKGLKTLRQLEDTPCMCPKFSKIPNELGTALAVLEFVENG